MNSASLILYIFIPFCLNAMNPSFDPNDPARTLDFINNKGQIRAYMIAECNLAVLKVLHQHGKIPLDKNVEEDKSIIFPRAFFSPLHETTLLGQVEKSKYLIEAGAPINQKEKNTQRTPLHCALYEKRTEIVNLFLEYKDKLDLTDESLWKLAAEQYPDNPAAKKLLAHFSITDQQITEIKAGKPFSIQKQ